ncbi:hypothetical protein ACI3KS_08940 [Microbacterium sp. ZW T5_45]|uniref:hypothetical protein n=1 Tax=Microbacterium sp. ZW T5_45 TaxID=3378080 RepID=UPI003853F6A1
MNTKRSSEEDAGEDTAAHSTDTDATPSSRAPGKRASEADTDWQRAVGMHWHPYSATAETAARADFEEHDRSSKPKHIASQSPDERG